MKNLIKSPKRGDDKRKHQSLKQESILVGFASAVFLLFKALRCSVYRLLNERPVIPIYLFVCFCGRPLSKELGIPIGILPTSGAGVDGNAPYQVNPGIQTNFLPPRPVQS